MRELEVHNVTDFKADAIADLIKSRGFVEEVITKDHPGFKATDEYFEKMKASMPKEEYEQLVKEMEELMADKSDEDDTEDLSEGGNEVFFDPEEKKKYEEYKKTKREKRDKKRAEKAEKAAAAAAEEKVEAGNSADGEKKDL